MKKKFLMLAIVAMSFIGFSATAQTAATDNATPQIEKVKGKKADKKKMRPQVNLFEGITLTEAQQTKLQEIDSKRKAAIEQKMQARKDDKQRKDSAKIADRRTARKSYLNDVKAVLTPDQYVVFLENSFVNGGGDRHGKASINKGKDIKKHAMRQGREEKKQRHHASKRDIQAKKATKANSL